MDGVEVLVTLEELRDLFDAVTLTVEQDDLEVPVFAARGAKIFDELFVVLDLAAPLPQVAASLRERLTVLRRRLAPGRPEVRQRLSREDRAQLRALGYVEVEGEPHAGREELR